MEEQIAKARSMGLTKNSLPEASLGDNCYSRQSVCVLFLFLWSFLWYSFYQSIQTVQIADIPCTGIAKFSHVRWKCQSFSNLANTASRQSFLLEGLNRFSVDKYPSFWEKLPKFVLNKHWRTRQFSNAIPPHFSSRKNYPADFSAIFMVFILPEVNMIGSRVTVDAPRERKVLEAFGKMSGLCKKWSTRQPVSEISTSYFYSIFGVVCGGGLCSTPFGNHQYGIALRARRPVLLLRGNHTRSERINDPERRSLHNIDNNSWARSTRIHWECSSNIETNFLIICLAPWPNSNYDYHEIWRERKASCFGFEDDLTCTCSSVYMQPSNRHAWHFEFSKAVSYKL